MATQVAIIDGGGANIASLLYALRRIGAQGELTADPATIRAAERVILPGVGAARNAMQRLHDAGLVDVIRGLTCPVLGICLGMQLLCEASEEEDVDCLCVLPGVAARLQAGPGLPVPNMGWCATAQVADHPLLDDVPDNGFFYFVHSYALPVMECTLAAARHDKEFSAIIGSGNFLATQFHPERSSAAGSVLLRNFVGGRA